MLGDLSTEAADRDGGVVPTSTVCDRCNSGTGVCGRVGLVAESLMNFTGVDTSVDGLFSYRIAGV